MGKNSKKKKEVNPNTSPLGSPPLPSSPASTVAKPSDSTGRKKTASAAKKAGKAKKTTGTAHVRFGHQGAVVLGADEKGVTEGSGDDVYTYSPDVADLEALKVRKFMASTSYPVGYVANSKEMRDRKCTTLGKGKCISIGMKPTTSADAGVFVGFKRVRFVIENITDMPISVTATAPRCWSQMDGITDTYIAFPYKTIQPGGKVVFEIANEWDPVFYGAKEGPPSEDAKFELLRMVVFAGNAWSEKFAVSTIASGVITTTLKGVEAFKVHTDITYLTTGASPSDGEQQKLLDFGYSYDFSYLEAMNGKKPMPPSPAKYFNTVGSQGKAAARVRYSGALPTSSLGAPTEIANLRVNLMPTGSQGLCLATQDWTDSEYGSGAFVYLALVDENYGKGRPPQWKLQGATVEGQSQEANLTRHNIIVPGSAFHLIYDEHNDDCVVSAGIFKYWAESDSFVAWDYKRNRPVLVGGGYDYSYNIYTRPAFAPSQTVLQSILDQPAYSGALFSTNPKVFTITWAGAVSVMTALIEVIQIAKKVYDLFQTQEMTSMYMLDPQGELKRYQQIRDDCLRESLKKFPNSLEDKRKKNKPRAKIATKV